jgi:succinate dehydrogenase / fumarate reductase membrane anchor subunit
MVKSVLGVNHQGLTEWLFQRITALVMAIYTIGLLSFMIGHSPLEYSQWHDLFANTWIKIATLILVLSLLYHAWIGMWTILTDYVKLFVLNLILQIIILLSLIACFFYSLLIVWGV